MNRKVGEVVDWLKERGFKRQTARDNAEGVRTELWANTRGCKFWVPQDRDAVLESTNSLLTYMYNESKKEVEANPFPDDSFPDQDGGLPEDDDAKYVVVSLSPEGQAALAKIRAITDDPEVINRVFEEGLKAMLERVLLMLRGAGR